MPAPAAAGLRDPYFASVPFERWQAEGKRHQIRWDVEFSPVELSVHQRLLCRVRIEIDHDPALEPVPRALAALIEYRDSAGNVWQTHVVEHRGETTSFIPRHSVFFGNAFVLPGSYLVSIAVFDPNTLEHSFISRKIRVKALSNDPLAQAWRNLPAVELLPPNADPPDEWFLPSVSSRMSIPVKTRRPVRLDVFVNETPGGYAAGSVGAMRRNMSVLIPALKVISQTELTDGSINIRMVDLVRRRVVFRQDEVTALDWPRLRGVFFDTKPGVVDVSTLAGFWKMRNFFWEQVTSPDPPPASTGERVVLVLSGPAFFAGQEQLPADIGFRSRAACIFYVRYRPPDFAYRRMRARPGSHPLPLRALVYPMAEDDLEQAARKLGARIYDVTFPGDFRRVLATIFAQISEL